MIYLDHSATTPTDPRVLDVMLPYFTETFGNASSSHAAGRAAQAAIANARQTIAQVLNCQPHEIIFTSGGSESDNLAVRGIAWSRRQQGKHIITTPIEHGAILKTVQQLTTQHGFSGTLLPVDTTGQVSIDAFRAVCCPGTTLASVMYANNEVGTIQPIAALARVAKEHAKENNIIFHTDAVQAGGQLPLDVQALGVDLLSLSAHKFYGPKGIGLLYMREGIGISAQVTGGSQEAGLRAGTYNTPLIVGMAKALELAYTEFDQRRQHFEHLRNRLIQGVLGTIPGAYLTGHPTERLSTHASFVFDGLPAGFLTQALDSAGIAASSASACKAGSAEPSGVLLALNYSSELAASSLRLTVGLKTTEQEIDCALEILETVITRARRFVRPQKPVLQSPG